MTDLYKFPGKLETAKPFRRSHYKGGRKLHGSRREWEWIAWDGEGTAVDEPIWYGPFHADKNRNILHDYVAKPQPYVLLGNSKEQNIKREEGLETYECLEFMLETKEEFPKSIFIGFSFNYDVNQILKDLPESCLWDLHETNHTFMGGYSIKWLPRKEFYVKHGRTHRSFVLYDVFGFFQSSFLTVCEKYLSKDDARLTIIREGKAARDSFSWDELDEFIVPYNMMELEMLCEVMDLFRADLHNTGIHPGKWHGPGAIANEALRQYGVKPCRDIPEEVLDAAQYAYAGGRFEHFFMGRYDGPVYEADIHSAYPEAAAKLPDLQAGHWESVERFEPGTFGVWAVDYRQPAGYKSHQPQPLFCRAESGSISYPRKVSGWYWTPEAELVADYVRTGWVFRPTSTSRPFAFVEQLYEQRRIFKSQGSSTERAIKLILNSLYGKLAQTVGGKEGPPSHHQLEHAGYITSYTRAKIYKAMMQHPDKIIASETDAVFSMVPLDLDYGEGLGQWELKEYDSIVYLQSGFYYATQGEAVICKYRGMDRDRETMQPAGLPYRTILDHLDRLSGRGDWYKTPSLSSYTTRFVGLGIGLRTSAVWRSWEKNKKIIRLDQDPWSSKRVHIIAECDKCQAGISLYREPHPLLIGGYAGNSYARSLPWRHQGIEAYQDDPFEWFEMNPEFRDFGHDLDRWQ
jgi:hypothetical protein